MSVEENKALVRRFYDEVWGKKNFDVADEIFAEGYVRHDARGDAPAGPAGQKKVAAEFLAAFPDWSQVIDLIVADGDIVVVRWTSGGTNSGPWGGVEATGKHAKISGVNIFRVKDGKVIELWNHRDDLGMMQQLGAPIFAGANR